MSINTFRLPIYPDNTFYLRGLKRNSIKIMCMYCIKTKIHDCDLLGFHKNKNLIDYYNHETHDKSSFLIPARAHFEDTHWFVQKL